MVCEKLKNSLTGEEIYNTIYDAYIYAMPLVIMDINEKLLTNTMYATNKRAPINQLIHEKDILTKKAIDDKNNYVRSVYSHAYFDLTAEPYIFETNTKECKTLIKIVDGFMNKDIVDNANEVYKKDKTKYAIVGPDYYGKIPDRYFEIKATTNKVWMLVQSDFDENFDISKIYDMQNNMKIYPLSSSSDKYFVPNGRYVVGNDYRPKDKLIELDIQAYFNRFNELIINNTGSPEDREVLARFEQVGIGYGCVFNLGEFSAEIQKQLSNIPAKVQDEMIKVIEDSKINFEDYCLNDDVFYFGTDYKLRAAYGYKIILEL